MVLRMSLPMPTEKIFSRAAATGISNEVAALGGERQSARARFQNTTAPAEEPRLENP